MPALSCFQLKRGLFRFGLVPSGKALGVAPFAVFSRYKDLSRSLFPNCFFHFFFTFFNGLFRFFSCCKGLRPPFLLFRCLAVSLVSVDHRRSQCVKMCMKHFAPKAFLFGITWLHFLFSSFFDLFIFIYGWSQWYRRTLLFVDSYFVISAATQFEDDFFFNFVETPRISTLSFWIFRLRSFFVNHCFITAQLIRDSATLWLHWWRTSACDEHFAAKKPFDSKSTASRLTKELLFHKSVWPCGQEICDFFFAV